MRPPSIPPMITPVRSDSFVVAEVVVEEREDDCTVVTGELVVGAREIRFDDVEDGRGAELDISGVVELTTA